MSTATRSKSKRTRKSKPASPKSKPSSTSLSAEERRKLLVEKHELAQEALRRKQAKDLVTYAPTNLTILDKAGREVKLELNRAQRYAHMKIEAQLARTGRVRALVLKARKQGLSTYTAGRFYWKVRHQQGAQANIMAHVQDSSDALFRMVSRFQEKDPGQPALLASSAKELHFKATDSRFLVTTAGAKATGRGQTPQYLLWSEVAFSPNPETHLAGMVQAVPNEPGTEIVLESTANGIGNVFHGMWQESEAGLSDYIAIFCPWFWTDEYVVPVGPDFQPDEQEINLMQAFDLTLNQVAWRRMKIRELRSETLFKQEYPATAQEAFQSSGGLGFITPDHVVPARNNKCEGLGPLIVGVDPARGIDIAGEGDRFSIAWRRGRKCYKVESHKRLGTLQAANILKGIIDNDKPARVFMDVGGNGGAIFDVLESWGEPYAEIVKTVNFGSAAQDAYIRLPSGEKRAGPKNRRAEMWQRMKDWFEREGGVEIPNIDSLQADLCGPGFHYDVTTQQLILESKEKMRDRGIRSPDEGDALALTFAEPVGQLVEAKRAKGNIRPRGRDRLVGV